LIVMASALISGCIGGLAHVQVNIPPLEVSGIVKNTNNPIYIVVPKFYGKSGAFVSLVREDFSDDTLFESKIINISENNEFNIRFKEENRRIGWMFPYSPSNETMESRVLFIWEKGDEFVYKIAIHGTNISVEKTNIKTLKNSLPKSLQVGTVEQWGGPREKQIEEEIEFYRSVRWEDTDSLSIQNLTRSSQIDKLQIVLKFNEIS